MQEDVLGPLRELPDEDDLTICAICGRPLRREQAHQVPAHELTDAAGDETPLDLCAECDARRLQGDLAVVPRDETDSD